MSDMHNHPAEMPYDGGYRRGNGVAVASLVLGLVSVVLMCIWYVAMPCGILAIIFGVGGRKNAREGASGGGMATAGLVLGLLGLLLPIVLLLGCLAFLGIGGEAALEGLQKAVEELDAQRAAPILDIATNGAP